MVKVQWAEEFGAVIQTYCLYSNDHRNLFVRANWPNRTIKFYLQLSRAGSPSPGTQICMAQEFAEMLRTRLSFGHAKQLRELYAEALLEAQQLIRLRRLEQWRPDKLWCGGPRQNQVVAMSGARHHSYSPFLQWKMSGAWGRLRIR